MRSFFKDLSMEMMRHSHALPIYRLVLFNMATRDLFTRVDVTNYGLEEPQLAIISKILAKNGIVLKGENRNVKDMAAAILAYAKEGGNNA